MSTRRTLHLVNRSYLRMALLPASLSLITALLSACASTDSGGLESNSARAGAAKKILACKATDQQIASRDQCLQDDAACYQVSSGEWCTGERGNTCPAGSSPIAAGTPCPTGARCFKFSESLECKI